MDYTITQYYSAFIDSIYFLLLFFKCFFLNNRIQNIFQFCGAVSHWSGDCNYTENGASTRHLTAGFTQSIALLKIEMEKSAV